MTTEALDRLRTAIEAFTRDGDPSDPDVPNGPAEEALLHVEQASEAMSKILHAVRDPDADMRRLGRAFAKQQEKLGDYCERDADLVRDLRVAWEAFVSAQGEPNRCPGPRGVPVQSPALKWERHPTGSSARAPLATIGDDVLVMAYVWMSASGWSVAAHGDSITNASICPGSRIEPVVPDEVLFAAERWLREHVRGIAWPAGEEQPAQSVQRDTPAPRWAQYPESRVRAEAMGLSGEPSCGACAEYIYTGASMHRHDPGCRNAPPTAQRHHELKCWPGPFAAVASGAKRYEIRKEDRGFRVGDTLHLREWAPGPGVYTGQQVNATITYKTNGGEWGIPEGLCVLSIVTADRFAYPTTEAPPAQREPVAGWRCRYTRRPNGLSPMCPDELWELHAGGYVIAKAERYEETWSAQPGSHHDRSTAMLAAEDAAAERERARVEALGYRMVRK